MMDDFQSPIRRCHSDTELERGLASSKEDSHMFGRPSMGFHSTFHGRSTIVDASPGRHSCATGVTGVTGISRQNSAPASVFQQKGRRGSIDSSLHMGMTPVLVYHGSALDGQIIEQAMVIQEGG